MEKFKIIYRKNNIGKEIKVYNFKKEKKKIIAI
jgi:hypothetical protein